MSFTQDELQAFNTILDQRLSAQRRELERAFDQRFNALKYDFELRLSSLQQNLVRGLSPLFSEQQLRLRETLDQRLQNHQARVTQTLEQEHALLLQKQQAQFEDVVDRALAAQLLAIEQLISHHDAEESHHSYADTSMSSFQDDLHSQTIESIEVQTEIPWDDVADMFSKALDERMTHLNTSLQNSVQLMEQHVLAQVRSQGREQETFSPSQGSSPSSLHSLQEVLSGIDQLERIVESVQVAMTANHAFLSNRLFHHQHLPLERAHPQLPQPPPARDPLSLSGLHSSSHSFSGEPETTQ
jgi:hypothetical protein